MLFNQPSSMDEVIANGVTPDNTGIQSKDYYKNIDAVQQTFTDQSGKFDEVAFDNFYKSALNMYNQFSTEDWTKKLLSEMDRDPFDWTQPLKTNVKDISATVTNASNPERRSMSITGIGTIGDPTFSIREIAQASEVKDQNGNSLGWTPNQKGIMSIFEPTVALATWDEDGMHEENGMQIMHKKGDYKTNENGDYFYEVLGSRESYNKEILRATDVLTTDGSTLNKFDFMDSDGLTKSVGSVVGKTFMQITPLLIPGVREVYGTISAITTLTSVLPTLGKSVNGILGGDGNEIDKSLTKMENWFGQFKPTQSDKGKQSFFTLENIGELMTSSAKQLYQQKSLANLAKLINKNDALRASNWGQRISLGYLAVTSSQDAYADFKRAGASDAVAGIGMLASTAALYGLMYNDYFKDWLFKGTFMDDSEALDVIKAFNRQEVSKIHASIGATTPDKLAAMNLYERMRHNIQKGLKKFVESPFAGKHPDLIAKGEKAWNGLMKTVGRSINEGVEETAEEIVFDAVKGITVALDAMGIPTTENGQKLNFGFTLEDTLLRYASSFVGGALGGAVFEGLNTWERTFGPKIVELSDLTAKEQMSYLIMTGRADELRDKAKALYDKGQLGDKNLSASVDKVETLADGTKVFGQGTEQDNQNLAAYNAIMMQIDYVESILMKHGMNLMMDTFDTMDPTNLEFNSDYKKAAEKQASEQDKEKVDGNEYLFRHKSNALLSVFNERKFDSSYVNDVVEIGKRFVEVQAKIDALNATNPTEEAGKIAKNKELEFLNEQLKDLQKQRDALLKGEGIDKYVHEVLFTTSRTLRDTFLGEGVTGDATYDELRAGAYWSNTVEGYVKSVYHKNYHELSEAEQKWYKKEFDEYRADTGQDQLRRAARLHYKIIQDLNDSVSAIEDILKDKTRDNYHDHSTLNAIDSNFNRYERLIDYIAEAKAMYQVASSQLQELIANWNPEEGDLETNEEYIAFVNEIDRLAGEITNAEKEVDTFSIIYGENADTGEAITEEGRAKLYNVYVDLVERLRGVEQQLGQFDIIASLDERIAELTMNIDGFSPDEFTTQEDFDIHDKQVAELAKLQLKKNEHLTNIDGETRESLFASRSEIFAEMMNLVQNYYTHLKEGNMVSENDVILKRIVNTIAAKVLTQLETSPIEVELNVDESMEKDLVELNKAVSQELSDYFSRLKTGELSEAASIYEACVNRVREFITSHGLSENAEEIVVNLFKEKSFGLDVQAFVQQINDLKSQITSFSVIDLLHQVEANIGPDIFKVIDLLEKEDAAFLKSTKLDPYIINNPQNVKALKELPRILMLAASVFESSFSGLNAALNAYRKAGEELVTISDSTKDIVASDIAYLGTKVVTLLEKHRKNLEKKSGFHKTSEIKIKTDFVKNLLFKSDENESFIKRLNKFFGDDEYDLEQGIKELADKHHIDLENLDHIEDFVAFNTFLIELGDLIYTKVREYVTGDDVDKQIGEKLAQLLPTDAYKMLTGKITDDPKYRLTDWSTIIYLGSLMANKASDFWSNLFKIENANTNIVPIIGQEWNVQIAYALSTNPEIFNAIIDGVAAQEPNTSEINEDQKLYLKSRSKLKNFIFIQGGAGSGKTQAVAKVLVELLKVTHPDIVVAAAAPEDTQIKGISNALGTTDNYMFSDLMDKIHPGWRDYDQSDFITDNMHMAQLKDENINIGTSATAIFAKDADMKVLVIDEATFLSERELQILSKWAEKNNVKIIALGDRKQNNKKESIQLSKDDPNATKDIITGIEDCFYISGPELTESIRVANIAKANNLRDLTITINKVLDVWRESPWLDQTKLDEILAKVTKVKTLLRYYETSGKTFVGEKFIEEKDITTYIDEFIDLSRKLRSENENDEDKKPKVLLITDNPEKYQVASAKGLTVLTSEKAQGGEYDFVIIDKDLSKSGSKWDQLKDFYTCISRSKHGSVIVGNKKFKDGLGIEDHKVDKSNADVPVSFADNANDLKKWKKEILKNFVSIEETTSEDSDDTDDADDRDDDNGGGVDGGGDNGGDNPFDGSFDDGSKPGIETNPEIVDEDPIISDAKKKAEKAIKQEIDSVVEGKTTTINRDEFLKDIYSKIVGNPEEIADLDKLAEYNFIKLFSSAVLFGLEIKPRHLDKLYATGHDKQEIDKLVNLWNNGSGYFRAEYDETTDSSLIYYSDRTDYSIERMFVPITIVKGRINGVLKHELGKSPFKQISRPIRIAADKDVRVSSAFTYGSVYSGSRIFAPTTGSPEPVGTNKYKNAGFKKGNVGKTYTVWSECDILTDEDFEEMFQYQYTGGKPTNYTNTKGFTESTVNGTSTTVHDLSSGAQAVMINIHRSCGIADLYDILCIARFACGRIAYSDLTVSQQRRLGSKNNRMDAMRYMRGVLGDFGYNLLDSSDDEVRRSELAKSIQDLKSKYRLLAKNSQSRLLGNFYLAFEELKATHPTWYHGFVENVFKRLQTEPVANNKKSTIYQNCLLIRQQTGKTTREVEIEGKKTTITEPVYTEFLAKFDPKDNSYHIYKYSSYRIGEEIGTVLASGPKLHFADIIKVAIPSISTEEDVTKALKGNVTLTLLKESKKYTDTGSTTFYDTADDYDYIYALLNGIKSLDLNVLGKLLESKYYKNGFYLNDIGSTYQVGSDRNSNDASRSAWRVNDTTSEIPWSSNTAGMQSSVFELVGEFDENVDPEPIPVDGESDVPEVDTQSEFSLFQENLLNLHNNGNISMDYDELEKLCEQFKDDPNGIEKVLEVINESESNIWSWNGIEDGLSSISNPNKQGKTFDNKTESCKQVGLNPEETTYTPIMNVKGQRWILRNDIEDKTYLCIINEGETNIQTLDITDFERLWKSAGFTSSIENVTAWEDELFESEISDEEYERLDQLLGLMTSEEKLPQCD